MNSENHRVLVLEDDPCTLKLLTACLKGPSIDLVTCSEIEAAECLMDRERFDVLVTDLEVSDLGGLEGMRLVRHVACNFPTTSVIVFSGRINDEVRALGTCLGAVEFLEKPSGLRQLRQLVKAGAAEGIGEGSVRRAETLDELLARRCLTAELQPIMRVDRTLPGAATFGVEGLSRGPAGSPLRNPELLLDYASRKELLFEIELQCIEAVLTEGRRSGADGLLFINVGPRTLSTRDFAARLGDLVHSYGYRESEIVLELTEQQSILNLPAFDSTLDSLRALGFGLALDDYGSGFANLHLLQELPIDFVKIDGFFCAGIQDDSAKRAIVRSTVELARELGISTIMERVETADELGVVQELGVDYAQGYYFSTPLPAQELSRWLKTATPAAPLNGNTGQEERGRLERPRSPAGRESAGGEGSTAVLPFPRGRARGKETSGTFAKPSQTSLGTLVDLGRSWLGAPDGAGE